MSVSVSTRYVYSRLITFLNLLKIFYRRNSLVVCACACCAVGPNSVPGNTNYCFEIETIICILVSKPDLDKKHRFLGNFPQTFKRIEQASKLAKVSLFVPFS